MARSRPLHRPQRGRAGQLPSVFGGMRAARLGPRLEMAQLHAEHGALHAVHAVVEGAELVLVAHLLAPRAQEAQLLRPLGVVGHHRAALAVGAEILAGIEAEAAEVAHRAAPPPVVLGAVRLARVLDDGDALAPRDVENRVHVGRLAVQVHGNDGFRPRGDGGFELRRIHRPIARLDVHEHRRGARVFDGRDGGHEGVRDGDHFVAASDAGGEQRQVQGARAAVDADGVARVAIGGKRLLERGHRRAEDELRFVEHAEHGGVDFGLEGAVLRLEIDERNHRWTGLPRVTSWPWPAIDSVAASSRRTTRSPDSPPVIGSSDRSTHSTKWAASTQVSRCRRCGCPRAVSTCT